MIKNGFLGFLYFIAAVAVFSGCDTNSVNSEPPRAAVQYTVTFDADGGNPPIQTVIAQDNTTVTMPAEPTKDNNSVFSGWFAEKNGQGSEFTASTTVNGNITVYAKWSQSGEVYTVSFDADGGIPDMQTKQAAAGAAVALPENVPSKGTDIFSGWFTEKNGQGSEFTASTTVNGNITVYAFWVPATVTYTVRFDAYGGFPDIQTKQAEPGGTVTLPDAPTQDGYIFAGWFPQTNGQGTEFTQTTAVNDNITVYAAWTPAVVTYTVRFAAYGGFPDIQTKQAEPGGTVTFPDAPTQDGYIFAGWFPQTNGQGTEFTQTTAVNDNITVYAAWTPTVFTYTVTFDADGGTPAAQTRHAEPGNTVALPDAPNKGADVFMGWYAQQNGEGTHFTETTPVTDNITVYARWVPADSIRTVTFDADGGTPASQIVTAIENNMIPAPSDPVKADNTFFGWFKEKNGVGDKFSSTTPITGDVTYYASWVPIPKYTVTFDSDGGTPAISTKETYGSPVSLPAPPPVKGSDMFIGWYTQPDGSGVKFTDTTRVDADITVYAFWLPADSVFTVTFDADGGTPDNQTKTVIVNNMVTPPPAPTKDGSLFSGWFTEKGGLGTEFTSATPVTGNITVYAKWGL